MSNLVPRHRLLFVGLVLVLIGAGTLFGSWLIRSKTPGSRSGENAIVKTAALAANAALASPAPRTSPADVAVVPPCHTEGESASSDNSAPPIPVRADRPRFAGANSPAQRRSTAQSDRPLQIVSASVRDYRSAFKQNPVGSNTEITRALSGKNSRSARYLPSEAKINDKGELIDRWDQPLFFHQISGTELEIRSAGADKVMWTNDDELVH